MTTLKLELQTINRTVTTHTL